MRTRKLLKAYQRHSRPQSPRFVWSAVETRRNLKKTWSSGDGNVPKRSTTWKIQ